jgi:hypothetical protein
MEFDDGLVVNKANISILRTGHIPALSAAVDSPRTGSVLGTSKNRQYKYSVGIVLVKIFMWHKY